ncbi:MAG: TniQ family protein [Streptomycetaceae bacterium]|nr:TniQ family protein [Streptomycetaceae bacterium]
MFPFSSRLAPPSRLPRPIPPFPGETTKSYLYRLAVANQLHPDDLHAHLTGTRHHVPITLDGLAAATGRSPHSLSHALPELRPGATPGTYPALPAHARRTICRRCAAHRGAFRFATIWRPVEVNICPSHPIWLGPPVRTHNGDQYDVGDLPEILHAQRRHYRLARRHGRQTAAEAFTEATHITTLWARHGFHHERRIPLIQALRGHRPFTSRLRSGDPITPLVTYPESVDLSRVLAMPHWRHPTVPTCDDLQQFRRDIHHHLGIRYYPQDSPYDPLFHWYQKHHGPHATQRFDNLPHDR